MNYKVLVIVINYKTSQLIQELVDSLTEDQVEVSILIVDNASTKETYNGLLLVKDARIKILRSEENLGFTGGINYALSYAVKNISDIKYFFLLNPDAFSTHNLLYNLVQVLEANPDAACVSPQVLRLDGSPWYSGAEIDYTKGKVSTYLSTKNDKANDFYEVDVFSGCAVLFDTKKVLNVGQFNESLFMYYDEADISIRLKKNGYKIFYAPLYFVRHDQSYTTRNISYLKTYYMTRNKFIVFNDSMSKFNKLYFLLYELAFHLKNRRVKNAFYHLKGFYDFVIGKRGSCA